MQLSCADTLLGFVPVPPCAAEPVGQDQTECGAGCGSISNSIENRKLTGDFLPVVKPTRNSGSQSASAENVPITFFTAVVLPP